MLIEVTKPVLVFGSNLAGRHGAGAAKDAANNFGARYGQGEGLQGQSYALPTKDKFIRTLPLAAIKPFVDSFLELARGTPKLSFLVTPIGTGLAGYSHAEIAPMFRDAPTNCLLPGAWLPILGIREERLVIAGSRGFTDEATLVKACDGLLRQFPDGTCIKVVSGGAAGADRLGEAWAQARGLELVRFPAEWDRLHKVAGFVRNKLMAAYGTRLVAFWDGESPGTRHMLETARSFGLRVVMGSEQDSESAPGAHEVASIQPINVFSGEGGLGSILTNPTELARMKELLPRQYAVRFRGRFWPDAEAAYQHLKCGDAARDDDVMIEIVAAKLLQHPEVLAEVVARGGEVFLRQCSHLTGAKSVGSQAWEGKGMASRFIRNLVGGFVLAQAGASKHILDGTDPQAQQDLF